MSGHSKWANIKHRKQAVDAKRGQVFTKLAKEICIAAKIGGSDENSNPRLKTAIIKARSTNMPKDNIERAVKKGAGELEGISYEEIIYEAYGPGGVAFIIEVLTDKKSRTLPEIKNILSKAGGNLAENGAVNFLFDLCGIIIINGENINEEELFDIVIEAGGEDFEKEEENIYSIKTSRENFNSVLHRVNTEIDAKEWQITESGLKYVPKSEIDVENSLGQSILKLMDQLEVHDDVQNVYCNLNLGDWAENIE